MRRFESRIRSVKLKECAARSSRFAGGSAFIAALASAAGLLLGGGAAQAQDHFGTWLTDDKKAKIELRECGAEKLCSEIVWLADPVDENGQPWRDENHPEASKRSRPIVGIDILKGMKKVEGQAWTGEIYDPEEGKHYYLKRISVGSDKVEIRGCMSTGWPCRTKYWTRTEPVRDAEPVQVARREQTPAPQRQERAAAAPSPAPAPERRAETQPRPAPQPQQRQRAETVPAPDSRPEPPAAGAATQSPAASPQEPQRQRQAAAAAAPQFTAREPEPRQSAPAPEPRPQPPAQAWRTQPQPQARQQRSGQPDRRRRQRVANAPSATGSLQRPPSGAPGASGSSAYLVQVTAGQDQNEALRTFGKLQTRHPRLLGGYLPNIQKVDLGERGVWYRVRVGPMGQHTAATSFCQRLKAAGADCLIRRE